MRDIDLQDVFNRAFLYLVESGVEMTGDQCCRLLQLLEKAVLASQADDSQTSVRDRVIDMIPEYFSLPTLAVPEICPPLKRGSIGYNPPGVDDGKG
ncbi:hypothetical protein QQF73_08450 [Marinobacter sp. M216]|uniref:Uncharacterized protein n=1 Tax=Marinobacter albus TaxID=3030833 RepID=A0ABT7HDR7_9GAMM|nr:MULTISPECIES: hypothetical protein [unclassified Marinobacter]MBW7470086.1 hypothetical protein [Marinobacter sp. F4218]MDK9557650.1 hypothetical protein [Marinobacter sp. M216]